GIMGLAAAHPAGLWRCWHCRSSACPSWGEGGCGACKGAGIPSSTAGAPSATSGAPTAVTCCLSGPGATQS
ncbi:hypothetical protein Tco_0043954, partial [Tanacetum coccineum]